MPSDAVKYWIVVVAISVVLALYKSDIASGVIFFLAAAAVYVYWRVTKRKRTGRQKGE